MGGIGKTALALKLVELLKPRYPDAQFFLDLKGASTQPLTVAEALAHVIRAYHPAAKLPDSESELRGLYLSVLDGQRALLLMDNAANAEQVEPLIPPAGCLLLVTSRQHFTVPGLAAKNLDTLSAADARDLLLTIAPRIGTQADEIAALCGYLPLALRLAAAAIVKYRNLSPADYVRRLQDRQQRLQLIDASLSLSYELLSEELRERWRWLAVFPDTFADYSAAAVWEVEVDQAKYMLGELMAASLVEWNETSDRYRLHDLARLFADAKLSAEERAVGQKRFATHYRDVLAAANELYLKGGESLLRGLALFDLEWGNIQAGHAWVAAQVDAADADVARLGMTYPNAGAYVLSLRQHSRERIRWLEIALAAARRLKDREGEGATLGNLGIAYGTWARPAAPSSSMNKHYSLLARLATAEAKEMRWATWATPTPTWARPAAPSSSMNKHCSFIARLATAEAKAMRWATWALRTPTWARPAAPSSSMNKHYSFIVRLATVEAKALTLGSLGIAYKNLGETRRAIQFFEQTLLIASRDWRPPRRRQ